MKVVVDANVIAAAYKADAGLAHDCSGDPRQILERLLAVDVGYVDVGGQIEQEWQTMAAREWLEAWLGDLFLADRLRAVRAVKVSCEGKLNSLGFPWSGRDRWYVRTAVAVTLSAGGQVSLVSEDVDFYDPTAKQDAKRRARCIRDGAGPVLKALAKEGVTVTSVERHCYQREP